MNMILQSVPATAGRWTWPGWVLLGAVLAATTAACRVESSDTEAAAERARRTGYRGILVENPPPKPEFTLTDFDGQPFNFRAETDGYATLLFFGYTNCPDVCPGHMAAIAAVRRDLPPKVRRRVKVVFVTTDPERDTPERLREWLGGFDRDFIGLHGPKAEVDSIMVGMGLPPAVRTPDTNGEYTVGHAAQVIAFSADGKTRVAYLFGTRQADWKHDLPLLAGTG